METTNALEKIPKFAIDNMQDEETNQQAVAKNSGGTVQETVQPEN